MAILDLRPNCECCDKDLAPADEAFICSFECTFCRTCTDDVLRGTCPNCQGNLERRPIRPACGPVGGLERYPASRERIVKTQGCGSAFDQA